MNEELYLLIAGGRDFNDYEVAKKCLDKELCDKKIIVISGTAKGADSMGERWANEHGFEIVRYKPEWDKLGSKAGPLRNIQMYNFIKEKMHKKVITFWAGKSTGTMHMIKTAVNGGIPVIIYNYDGTLM